VSLKQRTTVAKKGVAAPNHNLPLLYAYYLPYNNRTTDEKMPYISALLTISRNGNGQ
jgi:hypothetical protein